MGQIASSGHVGEEPVAEGIGDRAVGEHFVPSFRRPLGHEDGGKGPPLAGPPRASATRAMTRRLSMADSSRERTALSHPTTSSSHRTTSRSHPTTCESDSTYGRFLRTTAPASRRRANRRLPSSFARQPSCFVPPRTARSRKLEGRRRRTCAGSHRRRGRSRSTHWRRPLRTADGRNRRSDDFPTSSDDSFTPCDDSFT